MWSHDHFEELAALAAAGQISGRELEDFLEHVEYCSQCKDTFAYFVQLHEQGLPLVNGKKSFFTKTTPVPSGMTDRFSRRAREQGIQLSEQPTAYSHFFFSRLFVWGNYQKLVAGAVLIVLLAVGMREYESRQAIATMPAPTGATAVRVEATTKLANDTILTNQIRTLAASNQRMQDELTGLKREHDQDAATIADLQSKLRSAQSASQAWQSTFSKHLADEQASLRQKDDELIRAEAELQKAHDANAQNGADVIALRAKVQELAERVRVEHEAAERERELISADSDIRDLMGARNLHIVDVIDADQSGTQTRAFGRVFYTEGKSLIFYAYDLSEAKLKDASYSFQVWGQKESGSVNKLGVLFQDDQHQRRWVLKVNDPTVLHNISSVFVTIGPTHGAQEPQGKELLYAFLDMKPNHP